MLQVPQSQCNLVSCTTKLSSVTAMNWVKWLLKYERIRIMLRSLLTCDPVDISHRQEALPDLDNVCLCIFVSGGAAVGAWHSSCTNFTTCGDRNFHLLWREPQWWDVLLYNHGLTSFWYLWYGILGVFLEQCRQLWSVSRRDRPKRQHHQSHGKRAFGITHACNAGTKSNTLCTRWLTNAPSARLVTLTYSRMPLPRLAI